MAGTCCRSCGANIGDVADCLELHGSSGRYGRRAFFCQWSCLATFAIAEGDAEKARRLLARASRAHVPVYAERAS